MTPRKTEKNNLRSTYGLFVEVGLAAALLLLILAFRIDFHPQQTLDFTLEPVDLIQVDEILQTTQPPKPPPPPRPQTIVEVPDDVVIEDEPLILDVPFEINEPLIVGDPPAVETKEPDDPEPDFFWVVEEDPELIGGLGEIQKQIKYPEIARKAGVEGRVIIQFIVDENGSVSDPAVVRGIGAGCDEEALRVVRQAKFKPGKQRGKAVKVKMSLPITFKLK